MAKRTRVEHEKILGKIVPCWQRENIVTAQQAKQLDRVSRSITKGMCEKRRWTLEYTRPMGATSTLVCSRLLLFSFVIGDTARAIVHTNMRNSIRPQHPFAVTCLPLSSQHYPDPRGRKPICPGMNKVTVWLNLKKCFSHTGFCLVNWRILD